jgi:hypothetical protein
MIQYQSFYLTSMGLEPCVTNNAEEDEHLHLLYDLLAPPLERYTTSFIAGGNRSFQNLLVQGNDIIGLSFSQQVQATISSETNSLRDHFAS